MNKTPTPEDFEQRAGLWLGAQATPDPSALSAVHASIDALPARRREWRFGARALAAAAVIVLVVTASVALIAREQGFGGPPKPPDPAAFAGDPRLALCGPQLTPPIAIFEMAHLSDYPRHFPNSYPLKGLVADLSAPALVVISGDRQGGGRQPGSSNPVETLAPGHHDLCIVVGANVDSWAQIAVIDVDTTGYLVALPDGTSAPTPPDPAAFIGDPRLKACFTGTFPAEYVFEIPHAREYQRYLPAMGLAPELGIEGSAFVVVFGEGAGPFGVMGVTPGLDATPGPSPTREPGRYVCILAGGTPNLYSGVDITGLTVSPAVLSSPDPNATPPDPAAFAGDPRLADCYGSAGPVQYEFEMTHARDYQKYLPAMGLAPELDVDTPAFVVVFAAGVGPVTGGSRPPGTTPRPDMGRSVCVLVAGTANAYGDVDITGMTVSPSVISSPGPTFKPTPTDAPAPAWTGDLLGQLQCDGPAQSIGGETGDVVGEAGSAISVEAAVEVFAATTLYSSMPARGYERAELEPHWARFEHRVNGRIKAIVILTDGSPDRDPGIWTVVGLRGCDPAEFAPDAGLTGVAERIWLDAHDQRVPTSVVQELHGPGHCGWESTIWLRVDGDLFIRDPFGVLQNDTVRAYDGAATLPKGARSTGYHEGGRTIWRLSSDRDSIYVVLSDRVERWPRAKDNTMGCA